MRWLKLLFRKSRLDRELDAELRFHLDAQIEENLRAGMNRKEARRQALLTLGGVEQVKEGVREIRPGFFLETLWQDIHFGARMLRKNRGFTAVAVLTLALGIGVNISIFSFVNAIFLRPLPVPESERLVSVYQRTLGPGSYFTSCSYPDYEYYRDHNRVFSGMLASATFHMTFRAGDEPERVLGALVSRNYFSVLGVKPALGRLIVPEEGRTPGTDPVIVLGHDFWAQRFGADPQAIGKAVVLGKTVFTVVGVAPRGFRGVMLDEADLPALWVPVTMYRETVPDLAESDLLHYWGTQSFSVLGRLRPGVSFEQARADMEALASQIRVDHPEREAVWDKDTKEFGRLAVVLYPSNQARFWPAYRESVVASLGLLTAVVGLVLLVACVDVANLMLARGANRQREIAVRLALGASRKRLAAQLLVESLLLSLLAGTAGLVVSVWTSAYLGSFREAFRIPLALDTGLDVRVLAFALGASLATGFIFGMFPAWQASRPDLSAALKAEPIGQGRSGRPSRFHHGLLVAQVALSLVLLISAGLFVRTLLNAQAADITVQSQNVLLGSVDLAARGYTEAQGGILYPQLRDRLRALPGVRQAAFVYVVPLGGRRGGTNIVISPPESPSEQKSIQVDFNVVTPGYFATVGIPIVRGRDFADSDLPGGPRVAVINEQFAQRFWPHENPLGKQFSLSWPSASTVEVVGVVRDGKFRNYRAAVKPCLYVPLSQRYQPVMNLEVRTAGNPLDLLPAVRREMRALDKDLPLTGVQTLKAHLDAALSGERLTATLLSGLGLLALVVAAVGIYGAMSFLVAQRTHEIGIRMALGASTAKVLSMVLRQAMLVVSAGIVIGLITAIVVTRFVSSLLYGVTPTDPLTFGGISLLFLAVGLLACYLPARRATKVDPMVALRYE